MNQPNWRSVYDRIAALPAYVKTDKRLKIIYWTLVTISAISTAYVNGWSHREVLGPVGAIIIGALTFAIVEGTLFTLEEGLRDVFKGGTQRMLAWLCKTIIKGTMILNAIFVGYVWAKREPPELLQAWNYLAFGVHFGIGLILVPMIRNADPVVAARMLKLRAEMAHEDQITTRMVAAMASPFGMLGASLRGFSDSLRLAWALYRNKEGFNVENYIKNMNAISREAFGFVEGQLGQASQLPGYQPAQIGPQTSHQLPGPAPAKIPPLPTPPPVLPAPSRTPIGSNGHNGHSSHP